MSRARAVLAALAATLVVTAPAFAITNGQPDGDDHPHVGQLLFFVPDAPSAIFDDPGGWFNCTGTLVSPTIVLTAGHCTFGVGLNGESTTDGGEITTAAEGGSGGNDIWIDFREEANYDGFPPSANYEADEQHQRYLDRAAWLSANGWVRGTSVPHPGYDDLAFIYHDMGVVELSQPIEMDTYGTIPAEGYLNTVDKSKALFHPVGYGLEASGPQPQHDEGGDTRRISEVKINTLNSSPKNVFAVFSNNNGQTHKGGTCFGDSGGPIFDGANPTLVVAVTSWGNSTSCSGVGGGYRVDQPDDLEFLAEFGVFPED